MSSARVQYSLNQGSLFGLQQTKEGTEKGTLNQRTRDRKIVYSEAQPTSGAGSCHGLIDGSSYQTLVGVDLVRGHEARVRRQGQAGDADIRANAITPSAVSLTTPSAYTFVAVATARRHQCFDPAMVSAHVRSLLPGELLLCSRSGTLRSLDSNLLA